MKVGRILRFLSAPERTARGRGYGVHSPFAFRFVREALTQPWAYYAYADLNRESAQSGENGKGVRALFRAALYLRPVKVCYVGTPGPAATLALSLGNPTTVDDDCPIKAFAALSDDISVVEEMWLKSGKGMLFSAAQMAIFVEWDNLPHQRYDIMLP